MRLQQWKTNGWLQAHQTTPGQIADLLAIVDRDLEDSMRDLSPPAPHFNTPRFRVFSLRSTSSMDWKATGGNRAVNSFSAFSA